MMLGIVIEEERDGVFLISLEGHLDSVTYMELKDKVDTLLNPDTKGLIFDMKDLVYISSAGMGVIFGARKYMEQNNGKLAMTNLQPQIEKAFKIMESWPGEIIMKNRKEIDNYLAFSQEKEMKKKRME